MQLGIAVIECQRLAIQGQGGGGIVRRRKLPGPVIQVLPRLQRVFVQPFAVGALEGRHVVITSYSIHYTKLYDIVADMLAYSRSTTTEFQPARVEEILDTVLRLAASDYDLKKKYDFKQVEIVRDFDPEFETLVCDHTEIEQVLLNVIKNAAQAMADGGTPLPHRIILRTRRA